MCKTSEDTYLQEISKLFLRISGREKMSQYGTQIRIFGDMSQVVFLDPFLAIPWSGGGYVQAIYRRPAARPAYTALDSARAFHLCCNARPADPMEILSTNSP